MPDVNDISRDIAASIASKRLTRFEGRDVTRCRVEIPGAAGGLRDALDFDPLEIGHDEEVTLVMRLRCKKVRFDEIKDSDCLARVHVLEPIEGEATFVEEAVVEQALADQKRRVREAQQGEAGLIFDEDGEPFGNAIIDESGDLTGDVAHPIDVGGEAALAVSVDEVAAKRSKRASKPKAKADAAAPVEANPDGDPDADTAGIVDGRAELDERLAAEIRSAIDEDRETDEWDGR